jgi:hypothetical protein
MSFPKSVKSKQHAPIVRPHDFVNLNSLLPVLKKTSSSEMKKSSVKYSSKLRNHSSVKSSSVKSSSSK